MKFFTNVTLAVILLTYFLVCCITSYVLTNRNYPKGMYTNWILLGGLTSDGATFRIRRNNVARRFVIAGDGSFSTIVFNQTLDDETFDTKNGTDGDGDNFVFPVTVTGLESQTQYYYATWDENDKEVQRGQFRTAPSMGQASRFKFATAGCSWSGSTHEVFSTIHQEDDLLFFLHLGCVLIKPQLHIAHCRKRVPHNLHNFFCVCVLFTSI